MNERSTKWSCTVLKKNRRQTPHSVNNNNKKVTTLGGLKVFLISERKKKFYFQTYCKGREAKRKSASLSSSFPFDLISLKIYKLPLRYDIYGLDLRGARMLQEVWLTNCGLVPPRVFVCQHDEVTKPISTVVVSRIKRTRSSSIVLSFNWGHEEPPGVARRAAIVWLENWNERSIFALEFCGGFVAVGTLASCFWTH